MTSLAFLLGLHIAISTPSCILRGGKILIIWSLYIYFKEKTVSFQRTSDWKVFPSLREEKQMVGFSKGLQYCWSQAGARPSVSISLKSAPKALLCQNGLLFPLSFSITKTTHPFLLVASHVPWHFPSRWPRSNPQRWGWCPCKKVTSERCGRRHHGQCRGSLASLLLE